MLTSLKTFGHYLNSTAFLRRYHAWAAITWLVLLVPSWFLWRNSLFWIVFISVYANIATEWGAWQAVRAEVQALRAELAAALAATRAEESRDQAMLAAIERIEEKRDDIG